MAHAFWVLYLRTLCLTHRHKIFSCTFLWSLIFSWRRWLIPVSSALGSLVLGRYGLPCKTLPLSWVVCLLYWGIEPRALDIHTRQILHHWVVVPVLTNFTEMGGLTKLPWLVLNLLYWLLRYTTHYPPASASRVTGIITVLCQQALSYWVSWGNGFGPQRQGYVGLRALDLLIDMAVIIYLPIVWFARFFKNPVSHKLLGIF